MPDVYQPYSLGSAVGRGLGKGMGQQLEREVGSAMIGSELDAMRDGFAKKDFGPGDMADWYKRLVQTSSRLDPEQGAALLKMGPEMTRMMSSRQSLPGLLGDDVGGPAAGGPLTGSQSRGQEQVSENVGIRTPDTGFRTPESFEDAYALQQSLNTPVTLSPDQENYERERYFRARPLGTEEDFRAHIDRMEARKESRRTNQQQRYSNIVEQGNVIKKTIDKSLARRLQVQLDEISQKIPGQDLEQIYSLAMEDGWRALQDGTLKPEKLGNKWSAIAQEYAKSRDDIKNALEPGWNLFDDTESVIERFDKAGNAARRLGLEESYREDLQTKGLSTELSSFLARPLSPALASGLDKIPNLPTRELDPRKYNSIMSRSKDKLVAALQNFDADSDSLLSVKYALFEKGYGEDLILQAVDEVSPDIIGDRVLGRELVELDVPMAESLLDILFKTGAGGKLTRLQRIKKTKTGGRFQK